MPHKMNPITAERICGVSRVVRAYVDPALQNNPLWHERDLTNSSAERIILPESSILTDYILQLSIKLMEKLVFYPENIEANLNLTGGLIMAERFMAELTRRGMGRQTAYGVVRKCALEANQKGISLESVVLDNPEIGQYLSPPEVHQIMDPHTYLGSAVHMVRNVLEDSKNWF